MNTPTITDDELIDLVRDADLDWHQGFDLDGVNRYAQLVSAVLALAEQRHTAKVAELEARIDALMLEHCPDEMTPEQVAEWAKHQKPAEEAAPVKCIDYQATIESLRARLAELEAAHTEAKLGLAKIYGLQAPAATEEAAQPAQADKLANALRRGAALDNDAMHEARAESVCSMGVGCGTAGVCYAGAVGRPGMCGRVDQPAQVAAPEDSDPDLSPMTPGMSAALEHLWSAPKREGGAA
jgi:hypothetical protein